MVFDRGQDVRDGADADALDVVRVVAGAAAVVVLALGDAVADEERQERRREVFHEQLLDDVVAADLDIDEMADLFPVGLEQLIEGLELSMGRPSGGRSSFPSSGRGRRGA